MTRRLGSAFADVVDASGSSDNLYSTTKQLLAQRIIEPSRSSRCKGWWLEEVMIVSLA